MCFREHQIYICGHIGYTVHPCNDCHHLPLNETCDNTQIFPVCNNLKCGTGGFYCRWDDDGARIELIYEGIDTIKAILDHITARMMDLKKLQGRLQEHYTAVTDNSTDQELDEAMKKAMQNFLDLMNNERTSKWRLLQLEKKRDAAIEHYTIAIPYACNNGGMIPALLFPPLDPLPAKIHKLPRGMGTLLRNTTKPQYVEDTTSRMTPYQKVKKPVTAAPVLKRPSVQPLPPHTPIRTFKNPKNAYLERVPIDANTGDRSAWIKQLAQQELEIGHEQARSHGVVVPTSPVKAKRVMQRDGPRISRSRKTKQEVPMTPTPSSRRAKRTAKRMSYDEGVPNDDVATSIEEGEDEEGAGYEYTQTHGPFMQSDEDTAGRSERGSYGHEWPQQDARYPQAVAGQGATTNAHASYFQPQQYGYTQMQRAPSTAQYYTPQTQPAPTAPMLNIESWDGQSMLNGQGSVPPAAQAPKRSYPWEQNQNNDAKRARYETGSHFSI